MEEWMPMSRPQSKEHPTLFSNWVISHLPAVSVIHYEMWTKNASKGSREHTWHIFPFCKLSFIHCGGGVNADEWSLVEWAGQTGKWMTAAAITFPCATEDKCLSHVTGYRTAKHVAEVNHWNGEAFKCCCCVIVPLHCSSSCRPTASVFSPFITASHFLFWSCSIDFYCVHVRKTPPAWAVCSVYRLFAQIQLSMTTKWSKYWWWNCLSCRLWWISIIVL